MLMTGQCVLSPSEAVRDQSTNNHRYLEHHDLAFPLRLSIKLDRKQFLIQDAGV